MGKVAFVLLFSLVLVLSIRSALGDDVSDKIDGAASTVKGTMSNAVQDTKETTSSWADWLKDKLGLSGTAAPAP